MAMDVVAFLATALVLLYHFKHAECNLNTRCQIPEAYHGDWYSQEGGADIQTNVAFDKWSKISTPQEVLECVQIFKHPQQDSIIGAMNSSMHNSTMLMAIYNDQEINRCYYCIDVLYRTPNIIQYKQQDCVRLNSGDSISLNTTCRGMTDGLPTMDNAITMFRRSPIKMNCITTLEGVYQFSYEIFGADTVAGICNNPNSRIEACQDPGSAYVDNRMFYMNYTKCYGVSTSKDQRIRYQCMGAWYAVRNGVGYTFAAVADTVEADAREKFKCMMTLKDQKDPNNKIRWVMSRFPTCTSLKGIYAGDTRLVLTRVIPNTNYLSPQCVLPRNMSGTWFTQGQQFRSDVIINETHIAFKTKINEFERLDTYYSCQQTQGTRYMFTRVTAGRCEVDLVCFDLMPRHHSVIRYRIGKPSRLNRDATNDVMVKLFRETCSWYSFTYNRDEIDWKYEVLILNPPTPVPCPIAGRFNFEQWAVRETEKYATRIRGVTPVPRIQVDCRIIVSELKSCPNDMNRIAVDAEYCETVDYRGRPVGEYDVSDHDLTCVGFWMEDYKSYLITWDEEDAISKFRCWVYERLSWTDVMMSRSQNARCVWNQRADSFDIPGTGLALKLSESERLFDDCPQRFDPGLDPYRKPTTIFILNKGMAAVSSPLLLLTALLLLLH